MISRYIKCILGVLLIALASACNDDIFVDHTDEPSEKAIEIAGDGGHQTISFSRKGIQSIGLELTDNYNITYYDRDGNEIPRESNFDKVVRINYTNSYNILDIYIDGNFLTLKSTELAYDDDIHNKVRFDYGHDVKYIKLTITRGQPMILAGVEYDHSRDVTSTTRKGTRKTYYKSATSMQAYVYPYHDQQCKALVSQDESWAQYDSIHIQLPTYTDGQWTAGSTYHLQMNRNYYYQIARLDHNLMIPVDVQANTTTLIICEITYADITTVGTMVFRNPVSGREHTTAFRCSVSEPLSYDIVIKEED